MKQIIKTSIPVVILIALGFTFSFLQSCRKTSYYGTTTPYTNDALVSASIQGFITNEAGTVNIENATVTIGAHTTLTDVNGYFHFENITVPQHATTVLVNKADYFNGSRTLMVKANQSHVVKIGLIEKGTPTTFVASNGGVVNVSSGLSIGFPANGVVNKSTGLPYSGQVYVFAHKIDPTTEAGRNSMPGDLRGITNGNEERLLQSYGMMVAELYTVDGQALQIASGSEAVMTMTVPSSIASSAPASIPLWYFDEAKGMWIEEGQATLQGGKYVGKVKHFSFWNCDTPAAAINLEMTLVDQNGNPLSGYVVTLTNTANSDTRAGSTNTAGWVGGLCYPNATLTMNVYAPYNICGTISPVIYTQSVVTSSINLNLGTITVPVSTLSTATISGSVVDCSSNAPTNASILIMPYYITITPNALGQFSYTFPCTPSTPITVYAYDLTNNVYGTSTATLVSGTNNLGVLNACGTVSPFLSINMTNTVTSINYTNTFTVPSGYISAMLDSNAANTTISAYGMAGGTTNYVSISTTDSVTGTFPVTAFNGYFSGSGFTDQSFTIQPGSTITYTGFPLFPGDVLGSYSLNLIGQPSGNTYTATGSFRAPRQN